MEPIRIVAAVVVDKRGHMLVVRKRGTRHFMQPGGKHEAGETPIETLARELDEELGCRVVMARFAGVFSAPAANEPERVVEASVFRCEIDGEVSPRAEIEEIAWLEPSAHAEVLLAPLTRDHVIPHVLGLTAS